MVGVYFNKTERTRVWGCEAGGGDGVAFGLAENCRGALCGFYYWGSLGFNAFNLETKTIW